MGMFTIAAVFVSVSCACSGVNKDSVGGGGKFFYPPP